MKTIKVLSISFFFSILSCDSKSDSNYEIKNDLIIGRWQYITAYIDDYEVRARNCADIVVFDTLQVRKDYTFIENDSYQCIPRDTIQFHWERINKNTYKFQKNGETSYVTNKAFFHNSNTELLINVSNDTTLVYQLIK